MPKIPNPQDLPLNLPALDEGITYRGAAKKFTESDEPDKNGLSFWKLLIEVTQPEEWRGRQVSCNYMPVPEGDVIKDSNQLRLGRFAKSFGITDWDDVLGREGEFVIRNEEYPEGSGNMRAHVQDFLI